MEYSVPTEWITEAGLNNFRASSSAYRCDAPHILIAIAEIVPIKRIRPLDRNGFNRDRTMAVLRGICEVSSMPPIPVWRTLEGPWSFEIRDGYHRLYASIAVGFSHIPAEIADRY
jgi:hypothetical protein